MKVTLEQISESVAPASEPVTTAEIKSHLRIDTSDEDTLLDTYVTAAREFCENYTRRAYADRTYIARVPYFADSIEFPKVPIQSVTSVKYYDTESPSTLQTVASTVYSLVNNRCIRRNYGETWPSVYPRDDAVEITFVAGYGTTNSPQEAPPESVKAAIKLIVGDLYENREGKITGLSSVDNPTVLMLLNPYREFQ